LGCGVDLALGSGVHQSGHQPMEAKGLMQEPETFITYGSVVYNRKGGNKHGRPTENPN